MIWLLLLLPLATIEGVAHDSDKKPLPNVTVTLQSADNETPVRTQTDKGGLYRFTGLAAGSYKVLANVPGYSAFTSPTVSLNKEETKSIELTLKTSAETTAFFDEPHYSVAGVIDNTYRGGHGSDTVLRSSEALIKEASTLNTDEPSGKASAFLRQGIQFESQGNTLAAVRAFQQAEELDASEQNIFALGIELLAHLAPSAAIETFSKGNRLFPKSVRMLLALAVASYADGRYEQAAQNLFAASDLDPNNPEPYLFIGQVERREITDSDGYLLHLHRFVQLQPQNALANYYYGVKLLKQGQNDQATAYLIKATELNPAFAPAFLQLGIAYSNSKAESRGLAAFKKAAELDSHLEEPHYRLSQLYKKLGDTAKAEQELTAYTRIAKQNASELETQRSQIQRLVITLKQQPQ